MQSNPRTDFVNTNQQSDSLGNLNNNGVVVSSSNVFQNPEHAGIKAGAATTFSNTIDNTEVSLEDGDVFEGGLLDRSGPTVCGTEWWRLSRDEEFTEVLMGEHPWGASTVLDFISMQLAKTLVISAVDRALSKSSGTISTRTRATFSTQELML